mmetsp:Transcript_9848/g.39941  ORF Transcript_9848/g.39941 Transcript_9848/m.39941 type:complete len:110 (-) Transcript_9848:93-422(-)|eukprot:CAMPEP_0114607564 /NCGR_PEP_ID=MMETSP0168-20121206/2132_1 /TAXON_ID=95228 ORGANISM="Vannella sp., Strain DIVA3 517/6/12" /NCGR_SAMPLE_ID=MMETSP0168 /ASSEMBLY_ACC=CAM_ASM_000044 /LENGTH=109 /DNA_ID=CAMNT_0001818443 /DNA_START=69 /DNA_END=398 /DNA_ORIENTATION=+
MNRLFVLAVALMFVGVVVAQNRNFADYSTFGPPIVSKESVPSSPKSFATFKAPPLSAPPTDSYSAITVPSSPQTVKYFKTTFFRGGDSSSASALVPSLTAAGFVLAMAL